VVLHRLREMDLNLGPGPLSSWGPWAVAFIARSMKNNTIALFASYFPHPSDYCLLNGSCLLALFHQPDYECLAVRVPTRYFFVSFTVCCAEAK